jgi:hypothetical protein
MLFMFCVKTMRTSSSSRPSARSSNKRLKSAEGSPGTGWYRRIKAYGPRQRAQKPEPLHVLGQAVVEALHAATLPLLQSRLHGVTTIISTSDVRCLDPVRERCAQLQTSGRDSVEFVWSPGYFEAQNVLRRPFQSTRLSRAMSLSIALSPGGHLFVQPDDQAEPKLSQATVARLGEAFAVSTARGLEMLASEFLHEPLPPTFVVWRGFAQRLFAALCHNPSLDNSSTIVISKPAETELIVMAESAPPMTGLEYLNSAALGRLWDELDAYVHAAIGQTPGGGAAYLKNCNPTWNAVGRVTFHLAENKRNPAHPFAFLANLYESHFRAGQGAACAAGPGAGGIRRGQKPAGTGGVAFARSTGGRTGQTGARIAGFPRHLSSTGLAAGSSLRVLAEHPPL